MHPPSTPPRPRPRSRESAARAPPSLPPGSSEGILGYLCKDKTSFLQAFVENRFLPFVSVGFRRKPEAGPRTRRALSSLPPGSSAVAGAGAGAGADSAGQSREARSAQRSTSHLCC